MSLLNGFDTATFDGDAINSDNTHVEGIESRGLNVPAKQNQSTGLNGPAKWKPNP